MSDKKYANDRPYIPADTDRAVRTQAGHRCSVTFCGEHTYLEIHHIDENRENNSIENLILLCDKHHKMAHAGKIDKKSLHEYKRKLTIPHQSLHPQDAKAAQHFKENIPPNGLILRLKNEGFTGHLTSKFIDDIHALPHIWQSPYSVFNDADLQAVSNALKESCIRFGRTVATKTFGAKNGGDYYEVPPEYETEVFYKEVDTIRQDALSVCNTYDALVRLAISKGLDF